MIDQIANVVKGLKTNPYSRRHIVSAWNPADVDSMALPPCHCLFQFFVAPDRNGVDRLSCQLYQRSADVFLGVPFNIASYALLTLMMAKATGLQPGDFVHSFGDAHLYLNHIEQAQLQLTRSPHAFPVMHIADRSDLFAFEEGDFRLEGYDPHPHIRAEVVGMSLKAATDPIQEVCDLYAERCAIRRDDDWFLLKIQEELGELVQAHLRLTQRGRTKGLSPRRTGSRPRGRGGGPALSGAALLPPFRHRSRHSRPAQVAELARQSSLSI